MDINEFIEIIDDEENCGKKLLDVGCNAVEGLKIIQKYVPDKGITAAKHGIIYSVDVETLFKAGITKEDAIELNLLNWLIEQNHLACFV
jgi:hypothetical protein